MTTREETYEEACAYYLSREDMTSDSRLTQNAEYAFAHDLDVACADFLRVHQEWATPEGAKGHCSTATGAFLDLLLERNLITPQGQFAGEWDNEEVVIEGESHHVARVRDYLIDWTARQYDPEAAFPKITHIDSSGAQS